MTNASRTTREIRRTVRFQIDQEQIALRALEPRAAFAAAVANVARRHGACPLKVRSVYEAEVACAKREDEQSRPAFQAVGALVYDATANTLKHMRTEWTPEQIVPNIPTVCPKR